MFESIFGTLTSTTDAVVTAPTLLAALGVAFLTGLLISFVYMKTHKDNTPSQSFSLTLVLLPAVITIIILLVGSNIARAFSLAGAFSIIRFRSEPGDSKDISFVLFAMAVGLACGMGYLIYAVMVAVLLCAVLLTLELVRFGRPRTTAQTLKITIPENLDYRDAFSDILERFTLSHRLKRVRTTELGSLFELVYAITPRPEIREKDLIDELRCRNGNLNITLVLSTQSDDF